MNKQELLNDLKSKDFVATVGEPQIAHSAIHYDSGKWYNVMVREVNEKAASYRKIHFYVVNEGTPEEEAFYKDVEPTAQIKTIEVAPK